MSGFLLTRPLEDSQKMAEEIEKLGFKPIVTPLVCINNLNPETDFTPYQTLVLTSPKALPFLPKSTSFNLFCVGKATADKCEEFGFSSVSYAQDVEELLEVIIDTPTDDLGRILYLRGQTITVDLKGLLKTLGYDINQKVCYETTYAEEFNEETLKAFNTNQIKYTAFFSVQTAISFVQLIEKYQLQEPLNKIICISFSPKITEVLSNLIFKKVITCEEPSMDCFWKEVKNCVS